MARQSMRPHGWLMAVALTVGSGVPPVAAAPLDAATCERLKAEQAALETAGARTNMALGPAAAKATLAADKLVEIQALIELDAQLSFRCPLAKPLVQLKEDPPEPVKEPVKQPAKAKPKPKPPAVVKKLETGSIDDGAAPAAIPAPAPKRAAAKPKPDDAYRPAAPPLP